MYEVVVLVWVKVVVTDEKTVVNAGIVVVTIYQISIAFYRCLIQSLPVAAVKVVATIVVEATTAVVVAVTNIYSTGLVVAKTMFTCARDTERIE
jgi:hypothetical protein